MNENIKVLFIFPTDGFVVSVFDYNKRNYEKVKEYLQQHGDEYFYTRLGNGGTRYELRMAQINNYYCPCFDSVEDCKLLDIINSNDGKYLLDELREHVLEKEQE